MRRHIQRLTQWLLWAAAAATIVLLVIYSQDLLDMSNGILHGLGQAPHPRP